MMKIYSLKNGSLNEADRLELARLLIKAGYTVRIGKEKAPGKTTNITFVEFKEEKDYA
ncbi:MAG: resolvase [Clostridia bacterium]|nr:resolvase [Clostridia bacterium]